MKHPIAVRCLITWITCAAVLPAFAAGDAPLGYTDTPILPGQPWRVHDPDRPRPSIVTPGETFSQMSAPPSDAITLFDGTDLSKWKGSDGGPARWKVESGYLEVTPKAGDITTREEFGDFQLHLEFATPQQVMGSSQGRGNSGVFLQGRYEVQILDSYDNPTYPDGQTGAMYGQYPPRVNAVRKPGEWQTYDIIFQAPKFDDAGGVTTKAAVTVILNGVVVHHHQEYRGPTEHKEVTNYDAVKSSRGPIRLQDHGDLVRYRNIWIRPLGQYDQR